MKKIYLIGIVLFIAAFGGLMLVIKQGNNTLASTGNIQVDKKNVNVGLISMSQGKKTIEYELTNSSTESVKIIDGSTSCMCTEAILVGERGNKTGKVTMNGHGKNEVNMEIAPNEKVKLLVEFDPNAHGPNGTGPISREVYLKTNSTTSPSLVFKFNGEVVK